MNRLYFLRIGIVESDWEGDSIRLRGRSAWGLKLVGRFLSLVAGCDTALYEEQPDDWAPVLVWDGGVR